MPAMAFSETPTTVGYVFVFATQGLPESPPYLGGRRPYQTANVLHHVYLAPFSFLSRLKYYYKGPELRSQAVTP